MDIEKRIIDGIIEDCRRNIPDESCGLLIGKNEKVVEFVPTKNTSPSKDRYFIDPADILKVTKEARKKGLEIVGAYHSHIWTESYPSRTDIEMAYSPELIHLIVSFKNPSEPMVKAFIIKDENIQPVQILKIQSRESESRSQKVERKNYANPPLIPPFTKGEIGDFSGALVAGAPAWFLH